MKQRIEDVRSMFLDPRQFDFVLALESQWEAIRDEYLALPVDSFDPWVQRQMHGGGWPTKHAAGKRGGA